MGLHPVFQEICTNLGMMPPDTYRGWTISHERPPIPTTEFDWQATGPNYDAWGDSDGWQDNGHKVHAATREALIDEIDDWFEQNAA